MMNWTQALHCPRCRARGLTITPKPVGDTLPVRGVASCNCSGACYPVVDHALDLVEREDLCQLTMAGRSNHFPVVPWIYENVWRPRSLTLLTGEYFPVKRELDLMNNWFVSRRGDLAVDLGSFTNLYARGLERRHGAVFVVAVDLAAGMLREGRQSTRRARVKDIVHVRASVERLPSPMARWTHLSAAAL